MTKQWRIELFGGLCARRDEVSVTRFRTRKTGALLALLALSGQRRVRREEAIEQLWPGETTESGRSRLRMALTDIRKQLEDQNSDEPSILLADREHIQLTPAGYVTDKNEFETLLTQAEQTHEETERIGLLTEATALYQGELMAGYDEPWLAGERQRQADFYLLALRRLIKALAVAGQLERALDYARRCVKVDPLREESHRAVMQLYIGMGRPALAQQQYRQLEILLRDTLGSLPSASTRQLRDQCLEALRWVEEAPSEEAPSEEAATIAAQAIVSSVTLLQNESPSASSSGSSDGLSSGGSSGVAVPQTTHDLHLPPDNLPQSVTSFIGGEQELDEVSARLTHTRLLTLTGSGGCGKTRLALETARRLLSAYPDGVWLVELAHLTSASSVLQAIAEVLSIREEAGKTLQQTLGTFLKSKTLLLVLDNCEHLLSACAQCATLLLRDCPHVTLLASSREPLNIAGESVYRVPSLRVPDDPSLLTLSSLKNYSALQLFVERAGAVSSAFQVTTDNLSALAQICERLDGIPLALELAAARVRSLSLEEINARLDRRFHLLTGGSRAALPRHQTLRALIDYSYDLLNDQEKALLRRLSVFSGGWTLEAMESVCTEVELPPLSSANQDVVATMRVKSGGTAEQIGDPKAGLQKEDVLDLLTNLVDKSLVTADTQQEMTRYRLLETIRLYAAEQLQTEEGGGLLRNRHQEYFLAFAAASSAQLAGPEAKIGLNRLEADYDNLRAIFAGQYTDTREREGIQTNVADVEYAAAHTTAMLRLCADLWQFWQVRGYYTEGLDFCAKALSQPDAQARTMARARVLTTAGNLALCQNDHARAGLLFTEYLEICRDLKDDRSIAGALNNLGIVHLQQGNYDKARLLYEEALEMNQKSGNKMWEAHNLGNLGIICINEGDSVRARMLFERRLMLYRELGDRLYMTHALADLGYLAVEEENYQEACVLLEDSLAMATELGSKRDIAGALIHLGHICFQQGNPSQARQLYNQSLLLMRELEDLSGVAALLRELAQLQGAEGRHEEAMQLWGAEEVVHSQVDVQCSPKERRQAAACQNQSRTALGIKRGAMAFAHGRTLTWKQAVKLALEEPVTSPLVLWQMGAEA